MGVGLAVVEPGGGGGGRSWEEAQIGELSDDGA